MCIQMLLLFCWASYDALRHRDLSSLESERHVPFTHISRTSSQRSSICLTSLRISLRFRFQTHTNLSQHTQRTVLTDYTPHPTPQPHQSPSHVHTVPLHVHTTSPPSPDHSTGISHPSLQRRRPRRGLHCMSSVGTRGLWGPRWALCVCWRVVGGGGVAWWVSCYRGEMPPLFVTFVDFLLATLR